jgi:hypothetical protein
MNNLVKRIELLANVSIILVAVLLGIVLVKNYLLPDSPKPKPAPLSSRGNRIRAGMNIPIPDIDWAKNGQTIVLAISDGCHFCSESAPFYQRLWTERGNTHLVAVLPQPVEESKRYLNGLNVNIDDVRQVPLASFGVTSTPTLILVNDRGAIINSWVGKLTADRERDVLASLQ